ncbi:PREDICTED: CASP-like protein 1E1 [Nelumbo nucifera]|uniref:CASP-like protein n=2 Tax=Nelumbo nucifera TaxID=4432 RepID=A0A822Z4M5_NELNU|nr:PREDICTED: CASP-like protein 1E1 [Nelumbo nucifera]DAD37946.1 TPA_asm: hypothetical protein HUJ06_008587 [Nelumbo nucifera]
MAGMEVAESGGKVVKAENPTTVIRLPEFLLRLLAFVTTLVAAIVMGVNKETKIVPIPDLPPLEVAVTAKSGLISTSIYFVVANAIACTHTAFSLLLSIIPKRVGTNGFSPAVVILDVIMVGLLLSGSGAASAIGVVAYKGNSHLKWNEVCSVFGKYCHQAAASIVVSLLGSFVLILLVVLAVLKLHKKFK